MVEWYATSNNPAIFAKKWKTRIKIEILSQVNRHSFICQGTSTRRQRSGLFGLRVKLSPVTTCL